MNKTNAALVAVIVVLAGAFAWYASEHPATSGGGATEAASGVSGNEPETPGPRTLNADLDAAGLSRLALEAGVGEMHVTPSSDGKIHVQVTLRPKEQEFMWFFHWRSEGTARDIAAASINQQKQGDRLTLSLNYSGETSQDNLKQEWEVQAPVRLALDANLKVGELTIDGVSGGVTARLDVGELSIDTPEGLIDGEVNVGEIRAKSQSDRHGKISLTSTIGETVLYIDGKQSGFHEHGGLGNSVSADGTGPDEMRLGVNVGEASLRLTPADDSKTKGHT